MSRSDRVAIFDCVPLTTEVPMDSRVQTVTG